MPLRRDSVGDTVRYVVNRNINYTNICSKCTLLRVFQGKTSDALRGSRYNLALDEVAPRSRKLARAARPKSACKAAFIPTIPERPICPCRAVKSAPPDIHVHAFSPLEVVHGAATLDMSLALFELR